MTATPADVPILDGWNVWDVLQATAPVDASPGTLDQQLAAFVRAAVGIADLPIALTSSAAAGELVTSRASVPELAGEPTLGVGGSGIVIKTIAFEAPGGAPSIPWPQDGNMMLDRVYHAAPAPATSSDPETIEHAAVAAGASAAMPLALAIGAGVVLVAVARRRGRR